MHIDLFDRYQTRGSPIHDLEPRVKVVVTVLFILSNVLLPDGAWLAFGLSFTFVLLISLLAKLGPKYLLKRSLIALPFVLVAISAIFTQSGESVGSLKIGSWILTISQNGLIRFASIVLRSWLSVQMAILLTATTQFPDLAHAFRHLRVPSVLVAIISFMYRYLFILSDEALRLVQAREARSARKPESKNSPSTWWKAKVTGNMVGQLFLRSYERSDRVYSAMLARGYDGNLLTLNPHAMHPKDWVMGALAVALLITLQVIARI